MSDAYNPLDKKHLGESVADALLRSPPYALGKADTFTGAGVLSLIHI